MNQQLTGLILAIAMSSTAFAKPPHSPNHFGPGAGHPPPPMADEHRPLSPAIAEELRAQEDELLSWIAARKPEAADELIQLKHRSPELYLRKLHHIQKMKVMELENPEGAALKKDLHLKTADLHELTRAYHETDSDSQKNQIENELYELSSEIFELKQRDRSMRIDMMKKKIDEVKKEIKERESDKEEIVNDFVNKLLSKHTRL
jgi:hypothetical protein